MGNRAYVGPANRQPIVISSKTVGSALLPCTFVTEGASAFTQATAFGPNIRLLAPRDWYAPFADMVSSTDPLLIAYASGDSASAFCLEPLQRYMVAMAAATYTFGQELTISTAGRLAGASSTNIVIGFAREAGAKSAGAVMEVEICAPYVK